MPLTFASQTMEHTQYGIRVASKTENHMTSVERVFTYTEIDPEPGYNTDTLPPEEWPTAGSLTLQDVSLAYLKGAPSTLNNISVCLAAKEKVGVAGRSGCGKSSLVAALFRMPEPEGKVRKMQSHRHQSLLISQQLYLQPINRPVNRCYPLLF